MDKATDRAEAAWAAWERMGSDERADAVAYVAGADPAVFTRLVEAWLASDLRARDVEAGRVPA